MLNNIIKFFVKGLREAKSGFTLPEVIVATGIILVGVVGGITLISFSLNAVRIARNRAVAVAALQEGMELVRALRDDNWHVGDPLIRQWDDYISGRLLAGCANVGTYTVDATEYYNLGSPYATSPVIDCAPSNINDPGALMYETPAGRFTHTSAGNTPHPYNLRRLVTVIPSPPLCDSAPPCTALEVVVDVSYSSGSTTSTLRAVDQLWDWR